MTGGMIWVVVHSEERIGMMKKDSSDMMIMVVLLTQL